MGYVLQKIQSEKKASIVHANSCSTFFMKQMLMSDYNS